MTFKGWLGYLRCFFVGHKTRYLLQRRGGVYQCDRCPDVYRRTLRDVLRSLGNWAADVLTKRDNDLPF